MEEWHKDILRQNNLYLVENLSVSTSLLAMLTSTYTISNEDHENFLKNNLTSYAQASELCRLLPRKGPQAFDHFIEALQYTKQHFISYRLQDKLAEWKKKERVLTDSTSTASVDPGTDTNPQQDRPKADLPLHVDGTLLRQLLETGINVDHISENLAKEIFDSAINIDEKNSNGLTPLQVAASNGQCRLLTLLLSKGCDINVCDDEDQSLLHRAARGGHVKLMKLLIEKELPPNVKDKSGRTAVHVAYLSGHNAAARYLIENTDIDRQAFDKQNQNALHLAARYGDIESVKILYGPHVDSRAACGSAAALQRTQSMNSEDRTPLHDALHHGQGEVATYLIQQGFNVNSKDRQGRSPLHEACFKGLTDVAGLLVQKGAALSADSEGLTPLHYACLGGSLDVAKMLVDIPKVDIKAIADDGTHPLHHACRKGIVEVATLLQKKGADIKAISNDGRTPLHFAAQQGRTGIAKLMMDCGASINAVADDGNTPLHLACTCPGGYNVVTNLLQRGAFVDTLNSDGNTPLHLASALGVLDIINKLKDHGANVRIRNHEKKTASEMKVRDSYA